MKQDYKRLPLRKFADRLLRSGDLDPIYIMLYDSGMKKNRLKRWLLAYWMFYHAGVSSVLCGAEFEGFFDMATHLASVSTTPRGTERRHFRGQKALDSIKWLKEHFDGPEHAVDWASRGETVERVIKRMRYWPQFGPWIGFKAADMIDRVLGIPIKFSISDLNFYDTPVAGAKLFCKKQDLPFERLKLAGVVKLLQVELKHYKAPPDYRRPVGIQEIETILCKWKSHMTGHYPLGKDTTEIMEGLGGWGVQAERLRDFLPKEKHGLEIVKKSDSE